MMKTSRTRETAILQSPSNSSLTVEQDYVQDLSLALKHLHVAKKATGHAQQGKIAGRGLGARQPSLLVPGAGKGLKLPFAASMRVTRKDMSNKPPVSPDPPRKLTDGMKQWLKEWESRDKSTDSDPSFILRPKSSIPAARSTFSMLSIRGSINPKKNAKNMMLTPNGHKLNTIEGSLFLKLNDVKNLMHIKTSSMDKVNFYCVIQVGEQEIQSGLVNGSLNPNFNEGFIFDICDNFDVTISLYYCKLKSDRSKSKRSSMIKGSIRKGLPSAMSFVKTNHPSSNFAVPNINMNNESDIAASGTLKKNELVGSVVFSSKTLRLDYHQSTLPLKKRGNDEDIMGDVSLEMGIYVPGENRMSAVPTQAQVNDILKTISVKQSGFMTLYISSCKHPFWRRHWLELDGMNLTVYDCEKKQDKTFGIINLTNLKAIQRPDPVDLMPRNCMQLDILGVGQMFAYADTPESLDTWMSAIRHTMKARDDAIGGFTVVY